jgi:hypothetical protein
LNKIIIFSILAVILLSVSFTSISASPETEQKLIDKIKTLEKKITGLLAENTKLKTENTKLKTKQSDVPKPNTALGPEDCTHNQVWQNQVCVDATKPNTTTPMTTLKLNSLGKLTIDEGKPLSFTVKVTDKSLNGMVFNLDKNPPTGAKINPSTGMFTWTPDATQGAKSYIFDIVVTLGSLTDRQSITITVNDVLNTPKPNTALGPEDCTPNQVWQNQVCVDATKPPKNDLNLQTNLDLYRHGDVIVITGLIHNIENLSTEDVAIMVQDTVNHALIVVQVHPNADGSFKTNIIADGPQFKVPSVYTVIANFAGLKSEITFEVN